MVPEPQHVVPRSAQKLSSASVAGQFVCVLGTVDLDNQLCLWAEEISEECADRVLTAELESLELAAPQACP
jgi:hypothetical protein